MTILDDAHDFPRANLAWSREAKLANQIWFALDSANRFVLLRRWGVEKTTDIEYGFLRKHQETHFLDGLKKLGLDQEEPHIASAKYHVLSNALGGLDMGYRLDDQGRAWIYYFPPSAFGASSMSEGPGILAVPTETVQAGMRGWHANNGPLLGDDRLRFTCVAMMSESHAYDCGYFDRADAPLTEDERFRIRYDEEPPIPGPVPSFGSSPWPQERRDAALKKYSAQYAVGGLAQIAEHGGLEEAAKIAELSACALWSSFARPLVVEFGIGDGTPAERVARLAKAVFEVLGDELTISVEGATAQLAHHKSRLTVPEYDGWDVAPQPILDAFANAWGTASRTIGPPVKVTVERAVDDLYARWAFRNA